MTIEQFGKALAASGLMTADDVRAFWTALPAESRPKTADDFGARLVEKKLLTAFQIQRILAGQGGSLVMGDYAILAEIGAGGMGQVYKARHRRMERIVALKVMSSAAMKDEGAVKRFQREVRAAAKLEHPNIVTAYDSGEAGNVKYLVMQFVDGGDLSSLVKSQGALPVEKAVDYVLQAARGLSFAHGEGVIHRDIKPANLLVDKKGVVKILDMGLARIESSDDGLTATEQVMGTVDYMSPEQAANTKGADGRADIYSLGCTLWYLLTGKKAYEGDTMIARLMAHRDAPLPSLVKTRDDAPWALEQALHKMLAKRPQDRFQSMDEVVAALEPFGGGSSSKGPMGSSIGGGSHQSAELAAFLQSVGPKPGASGTNLGATKTAMEPKSDATLTPEVTASFVKAEAETDPKSQLLPRAKPLPTPQPRPVKKKKPPVALIAGGIGVLAIALIAGIIVTIKKKDGEVVATVEAPTGTTVEVRPTAAAPKTPNIVVRPASEIIRMLESPDFAWAPPENLGPGVNGTQSETFPTLSADELCLIMQMPGPEATSRLVESRRASRSEPFGKWTRLTGSAHEEHPSLSADGLTLFYATQAGSVGGLDIRMRRRASRDAPWGPIEKLNNYVNGTSDDCQPWLSSDGLALFFSSSRLGSVGDRDIWLCRRKTVGDEFGPAINAGRAINSPQSEFNIQTTADDTTPLFTRNGKPFYGYTSPTGVQTAIELTDFPPGASETWLSPDGERLYYGASLPGGLGGADIWMSRRVPKSSLPTLSAPQVATSSTTTGGDYALKFDGGQSAVDIPGLRRDDSGPFTLECWVRDISADTMPVVRVNGRAPIQLHFHRFQPHGAERNRFNLVARDALGPAIADNEWTHLAYVVSPNESRLFVNGKSVNVQAKPAPETMPSAKHGDTWVGSERFDPSVQSTPLTGEIDELRVSKVARYTPAGFTPVRRHEPDADTLALYHFDEGNGDWLADSSGNQRHGNITAAKWTAGLTGGASTLAPAAVAEAGWTSLFNGLDLLGWKSVGEKGWSVENGAIVGRASSPAGWLKSDQTYGDFELEFEYRLTPESNSGVFLRAPAEGNISGKDFHEIQLLDDTAAKFASIPAMSKTGSLYNKLAAQTSKVPGPNVWHKMSVSALGERVRVRLNDEQVLDGVLPPGKPSQGHVGFQLYPHEVALRNIRIRSLKPDGTPLAPAATVAAAQEIDLLALVDPSRDRVDVPNFTKANNWTKAGGKLVFTTDGESGKIVAPVDLSDAQDFEIICDARRTGGTKGITLDFAPSAQKWSGLDVDVGTRIQLKMQGNNRKEIAAWPASAVDGGRLALRIRKGSPAQPGSTGQPGSATISVNGVEVGRWEGDLASTGGPAESHPQFPGTQNVGLFCYRSSFEIRSYKLRVFEGEARPLVGAADDLASPQRNALRLTGGAYVDLANDLVYDGGDITFETWLISDKPNWTNTLLAVDHDSGGRRHALRLSRVGDQPVIDVARPSDQLIFRFDDTLPAGRPAHLAAVWQGRDLRLYIDGKRVPARPHNFTFTARPGKPYAWLGGMPLDDSLTKAQQSCLATLLETRITSRARYDADFTPAAQLTADADTVLLYKFDEGSGEVLHDSSGHGRQAKIVGAKWTKVAGVPSSEAPSAAATADDYAIDFTGINGLYIREQSFDTNRPFTMECTATALKLPTEGDQWNSPVMHVSWAQVKLYSRVSQNRHSYSCILHHEDGSLTTLDLGPAVVGKPTRIAVCTDGREALCFVDGKLVRRERIKSPLKNTEGCGVARYNADYTQGGWTSFPGLVDEARFSTVARYTADYAPQARLEPDADTGLLLHFDEGSGEEVRDSSRNGRVAKIARAKWTKVRDGSTASATDVDVKQALVFQGRRYLHVPDKLSWNEAKTRAEQLGGHLATITSQEEQDWIAKNVIRPLPPGVGPWIGGTNDGVPRRWRWVTGEPFVFQVWQPGEPTNAPHEPFLFLVSTDNVAPAKWADIAENRSGGTDRRGGFIVEWEELGTVGPASAAAARALKFAGTQESLVEVPNIPWGRLDTFTVEAWVRSDETAPSRGFVVDRYKSASLNRYDGRWQFTVKKKGAEIPLYASQPNVRPPGRWEHLAGVVQNKTMTFYVDGRRMATTPLPDELEDAEGGRLMFGRNLLGTIRAVRFSKSARYTENFAPAEQFESDADTLALYRFDEGSGNVLRDSSGHNLNGTIKGAEWVTIDEAAPAAPNAQSQAPTEAPFAGGDLAGWIGDPSIWKIENGELVGRLPDSGEVYLAGRKNYRDVEAAFDVKLVGPVNSGLQFRSNVVSETPADISGPQAEIGAGGKTGYAGLWWQAPARQTGRVVQPVATAVFEPLLKADDYNRMTVRCVGKHVTITLNGTTTIDGDFADIPEEGVLGWQLVSRNGPAEVRFRNFEVRDLSAAAATSSIAPAGAPGEFAPFAATDFALAFNGKDSDVTVPSWKYQGEHPLTVEAWAWCDPAAHRRQVQFIAGDPQMAGFAINNNPDGRRNAPSFGWAFMVGTGDGDAYQFVKAEPDPPPGRVTHFAGVYDGRGEVRFYVDGKLQGRAPAPGRFRPSSVPFAIGANFDGPEVANDIFAGRVYELRVSKSARYDGDFTPQARYAPDTDTIALYHFDAGAGDELRDHSGNNHHGKIYQARWTRADGTLVPGQEPATTIPAYPAPVAGGDNALAFNAETCGIMVPRLHYDGSHPLTIEAWTQPEQGPRPLRALMSRQLAMHPMLQLRFNPKTYQWELESQSQATRYYHSEAIADREAAGLVHVAAVLKDDQLRFFIDGKLRLVEPLDAPLLMESATSPFQIAQGPQREPSDYRGVIDEVRFSRTARYTEDFTPERRFAPDADTMALYHFDEHEGDVAVDASGNGYDLRLTDQPSTGRAPQHCAAPAVRPADPSYVPEVTRHGDAVEKEFGGHRYLLVRGSTTWTKADAAARARGGHLVSISSAEENQFLKDVLLADHPPERIVWTGGTRENTQSAWGWSSGEPWIYADWREKEGNDGNAMAMANSRPLDGSAGWVKGWGDWDRNNPPMALSGPIQGRTRAWGYVIEWDTLDRAAVKGPPIKIVAAPSPVTYPQEDSSVDLLAAVQIPRDVRSGDWRMDGGVLVTAVKLPDQPQSVLYLSPEQKVPEQYDLELVVEREQAGGTGMVVGIVAGGAHQATVMMDSYGVPNRWGLENIDGKYLSNGNPTNTPGSRLPPGKKKTVRIEVRRTGVRVLVDAEQVFAWQGRPDQLSTAFWKVEKPQSLFLGSQGRFRIHKIALTPR